MNFPLPETEAHSLLLPAADKQHKEVWSSRLQKWLYERFGVYIEDFRFQPEESTVEAEEPLSAKRWVEEEGKEDNEDVVEAVVEKRLSTSARRH